MNRRRFLFGAAALGAAGPVRPFMDGQTVIIAGVEHVLTDLIAPSPAPLSGRAEPFADYARVALEEAMLHGAPLAPLSAKTDRWGRIAGPVRWRVGGGRETTLQEILLAEGAARVAPQSDELQFIERCFAVERAAREGGLGLWSSDAYRIRDAASPENARGFQIYEGAIISAADRNGRVFFNFGADFRSDFTATAAKGAFRRWKKKLDIAMLAGRRAEVRGHVDWINGPSIELKHEMQMRIV